MSLKPPQAGAFLLRRNEAEHGIKTCPLSNTHREVGSTHTQSHIPVFIKQPSHRLQHLPTVQLRVMILLTGHVLSVTVRVTQEFAGLTLGTQL